MGDSVSWYPRTIRMKSRAIMAGVPESPRQLAHGLQHFRAQRLEVSGVGHRKHLEHEVDGRESGEDVEAGDFAETALQPVPLDTRVLVLGHHEAHAGKCMKGSQGAHVQ
jgi:hypothetical protein